MAMSGSGRMLKRATLALGQVTSGPAVTSASMLDGRNEMTVLTSLKAALPDASSLR